MKTRTVDQYRVSSQTSDGAGVKLSRLFSREDTLDIDPFLLLDTFESRNPADYIKGFPFHPHRGIQTFTYVIEGEIHHKDSMGNAGAIGSGEYQWMSAGSGVFHEEMPQPADYMLAFQLWVNLPEAEKMSSPLYIDGTADTIPVVKTEEYTAHILSGTFENASKTDLPSKQPIEVYDFEIQPNTTLSVPVDEEYMALVCTLLGNVTIGDFAMEEKAGATFKEGTGDTVSITTGDTGARVLFFAGRPLREPIAWGGPIVMNTTQELLLAQQELEEGTFVKEELKPKEE